MSYCSCSARPSRFNAAEAMGGSLVVIARPQKQQSIAAYQSFFYVAALNSEKFLKKPGCFRPRLSCLHSLPSIELCVKGRGCFSGCCFPQGFHRGSVVHKRVHTGGTGHSEAGTCNRNLIPCRGFGTKCAAIAEVRGSSCCVIAAALLT